MIKHSYRRPSSDARRAFSRRGVLRWTGVGVLAASLAPWLERRSLAAAQMDGPPPEWANPGTTKGGHGQLIVGDGPVYFSHFPMFMYEDEAGLGRHPHHFQVILEVSLSADQGDPLQAYLDDKRATGATLYTFMPNRSVAMLDLIAPEGDTPLTGAIVREHFERYPTTPEVPPEAIVMDGVTAAVERVVYAHEFAFDPESPASLTYVLFGQGAQRFLAHQIVMPASFDQVLSVQIDPNELDDDQIAQGLLFTVPDRADSIGDRLQDGERVTGEARATSGNVIAAELAITAGPEIYFEEGELRYPEITFEPTDAEIAAGFDT